MYTHLEKVGATPTLFNCNPGTMISLVERLDFDLLYVLRFLEVFLLTTCMRAMPALRGKAWNTIGIRGQSSYPSIVFLSFLCLSLSLYTILNNRTHTHIHELHDIYNIYTHITSRLVWNIL